MKMSVAALALAALGASVPLHQPEPTAVQVPISPPPAVSRRVRVQLTAPPSG